LSDADLYEIGLTQEWQYSSDLLALDRERILGLTFLGSKTKREYSLSECHYVDISRQTERMFLPAGHYSIEGAEITIWNTVFTGHEKVLFHDYSGMELRFVCCVFTARIQFSQTPKSLGFDSCIIQASFATAFQPLASLLFQSSVISELILRSPLDCDVDVNLCTIRKLSIFEFECKRALFINNSVGEISVGSFRRDELSFEVSQISAFRNKTNIGIGKIQKVVPRRTRYNSETLLSTYDFLKNDTEIRNNPVVCTKIEYAKATLFDHGIFNNILMRLFGFFLLPSRIIVLGAIGAVLFSMAFFINEFGLSIEQLHKIGHSTKLSVESFLGSTRESQSIGYLAISYIERLFGFFEFTAFTICLAKKYVK
jgi:hypothetical protein